MRHFKMTALAGALACGLALSACGSDSSPTTETTVTTEADGPIAIPLNADGTVDETLFFELMSRAEETVTTEVFTSRLVDPATREPIDGDSDTSYIDHEAEQLLRVEVIDGITYETFETAEEMWTRVDGGAWESAMEEATEDDLTEEETDAETEEYWEDPLTTSVEIIDLDARVFRINQEYRDDAETYAAEVTLDDQMRVVESFIDYGDGTAFLQETASVNEPVEFPTDLPI
ncbi:hypothetical protein EAH68_00375 [Corynebacterium hylobatis]|uniref:Uncharacterized protein n=1 Tax=Corynebacterium hylobatis TaxID=1859290 RepID=A0A430I2T1_9CORY|nr:hypothetical protein [Corynebacterium hylobatis]RSZ66052.1 hypothetical protein EAH68_00375 [Corynebacterium hylobatis]